MTAKEIALDRSTSALSRSFTILTLAAACMAALLAFFPAAGHDQLWFLLMAKRWLGGATLYGPEVFDSNPPLVVWLSAIPVVIAHFLHVSATLPAKALVLLLAVGVALLCLHLLPRVWRPLHVAERPALAFGFVVLFLVVPARDLGQRDALAVLLALPYTLCAAQRRQVGYPTRLLTAFLAGAAFCLKPQDALIGVAIELTQLRPAGRSGNDFPEELRHWLRSPEPYLLLFFGLLYLLAIRIFTPLYFTQTLPVLRSTYWAIGHLTTFQLAGESLQLTVLGAVTLLLSYRMPSVSRIVPVLCAAAVGAYLAYLVQGTGWYYQQIPAIDLFGAALLLLLLDHHRRKPVSVPGWLVPAFASLSILAVALTTHFTGYPFTRERAFALTTPDPAFFRDLPPGTPVAILTTSVDEAMMPVERYNLQWAQRTNNVWLLPATLRSEQPSETRIGKHTLDPATVAWLDRLQHRWMAEDLRRWRPRLVLVERCHDPAVQCQVLEDRHDDLLGWFQRDPEFRAEWSHYHFAGTRDRFDSYVLR